MGIDGITFRFQKNSPGLGASPPSVGCQRSVRGRRLGRGNDIVETTIVTPGVCRVLLFALSFGRDLLCSVAPNARLVMARFV